MQGCRLLVEKAASIFEHRNLNMLCICYVVRQVPVEKIVYKDRIVEVRFIFCCYILRMHDRHRHDCTPSNPEYGIVRQVPVEKIVQVEKIVEVKVPVDRIVEKLVEVKVPVDKIVQVEKIVEVKVPVDRIVEKLVEVKVPVDRIVEREKIVEVKVEKVVYQDRHVEVPVERIVTREKIVEVRFMCCCFMLRMLDRHRHACVQIGQINARMQVTRGEGC